MDAIAVIGAGAFGTAFASMLARSQAHRVTVFARKAALAQVIAAQKRNPEYLENISLHPALDASHGWDALAQADYVFLALPSLAVAQVLPTCVPYLHRARVVANLSKGFISQKPELITDFMRAQLPSSMAVASVKGPTFARDMLLAPVSGLTVGASTPSAQHELTTILQACGFRADVGSSIEEVEYLSILKNIYAIAFGVVDAKYESPNLRAVLFTRFLQEMQRLCSACIGAPANILLYAGVGDFLLTGLNDQSRNRTLGLMVGKGFLNLADGQSQVILEGLRAMSAIAQKIGVAQLAQYPVFAGLVALMHGEITTRDFAQLALA